MTAIATPSPASVTGLILAGGRATRLGGVDKGLYPWRGRPLISHVLERFAPQVGSLIISANRNQPEYAALGSTCGAQVAGDRMADFPGPLAGISAALATATSAWLAVVPCDAPRLPFDLVARLLASATAADAEIALPRHGDQLEPVFCLLRTTLAASLDAAMAAGERKVERWCRSRQLVEVAFDDQPAAFANLNSPGDFLLGDPANT